MGKDISEGVSMRAGKQVTGFSLQKCVKVVSLLQRRNGIDIVFLLFFSRGINIDF